MKHLVLAVMSLLALSLAQCGGGGGGGDPGPPHALEGVWRGTLSTGTAFSFRIDASGAVRDLQGEGGGAVLEAGTATGGPDVYTLSLRSTAGDVVDCPFLVDPAGRHGTFVVFGAWPDFLAFFAVMERGATNAPTYFAPDIRGSWSGYGYAYDQPSLDFAPFQPVTLAVNPGAPDDIFTVGLPGALFDGALDGGLPDRGVWAGTVNISGAEIVALMSFDKNFLAVMFRPATVTGTEDLAFYALNRN